PPLRAEGTVDPPHQFRHPLLGFGVVLDARARGHGDLDEMHLLSQLRMPLQEPFQRSEAMREPLGVIQPIDAEEDDLPCVLLADSSCVRLDFRIGRVRGEATRVDAHGDRREADLAVLEANAFQRGGKTEERRERPRAGLPAARSARAGPAGPPSPGKGCGGRSRSSPEGRPLAGVSEEDTSGNRGSRCGRLPGRCSPRGPRSARSPSRRSSTGPVPRGCDPEGSGREAKGPGWKSLRSSPSPPPRRARSEGDEALAASPRPARVPRGRDRRAHQASRSTSRPNRDAGPKARWPARPCSARPSLPRPSAKRSREAGSIRVAAGSWASDLVLAPSGVNDESCRIFYE